MRPRAATYGSVGGNATAAGEAAVPATLSSEGADAMQQLARNAAARIIVARRIPSGHEAAAFISSATLLMYHASPLGRNAMAPAPPAPATCGHIRAVIQEEHHG